MLGKKASGFIPNALLMQTIRFGEDLAFAGPAMDSKAGKAIATPAAFNIARRSKNRIERCGVLLMTGFPVSSCFGFSILPNVWPDRLMTKYECRMDVPVDDGFKL